MKYLKSFIPHIVATLIFFVLASIYFAPAYNGYGLNQHDMNTAAGMAKEVWDFSSISQSETFWTNTMFGGMPTYQIAMVNKTNYLPMIEAFIFSSTLNYLIGYLVIAMLSMYILLLCFDVRPWLAVVGGIAFGFATINILYLNGGHVTKVHTIALMPGIIAGLLYAYRKSLYTGAAILSIFLCLHISASHIQETYYLVYLVLGLVIVEFYRAYKEKIVAIFIKKSLVILVAALIGILPTTLGLILTYEHGKQTTRGKSELTINASNSADKTEGLDRDYIKQYNMGSGELWSLAIPNIKGGSSGYIGSHKDKMKDVSHEFKEYVANFPSYWGEQAGSGGAFYFGSSIFILFVLGVVFIKDKIKWAFVAISALAILLSMKHSALVDWFIDYVPMFGKFRDTKMILVLVQLAFPFLAIWFVNELFNNKINNKKLNITLLATTGLLVVFLVMPSVFFNFFNTQENNFFEKQLASVASNSNAVQQYEQFKQEIEMVRIKIFKADVLRSLFFMAIVGLLVFFYNRGKIAMNYFIAALIFIVTADLWMVNKRYVNNEKSGGKYIHWIKKEQKLKPYPASIADRQILKYEIEQNPQLSEKLNTIAQILDSKQKAKFDEEELLLAALRFEGNYRVLTMDNPFADASVSYYHNSIGGYHGAKLKRYQDLVDFRLDKELQSLIKTLNSKNQNIDSALRYAIPTLNMLNAKYIIFNANAAPIQNPYSLGSVWFVKEVKMVPNADAEIQALDNINPSQTAVVDQRFEKNVTSTIAPDSSAQISLKSYKPNHLIYDSKTSSEQVAIFSEIYYKDGWNAYIDGKAADYYRANFVLRAMNIPAGNHTIEFKFEPEIVTISRSISLTGSVLLILFIGFAVFVEVRKKKE